MRTGSERKQRVLHCQILKGLERLYRVLRQMEMSKSIFINSHTAYYMRYILMGSLSGKTLLKARG